MCEVTMTICLPGTTTLASPAATATADVAAFEQMFHVADFARFGASITVVPIASGP